jgi:hypothetical protein
LYKGLSFEQAPPISVPFSFYMAGSLMGVVSGMVVGYLPDLADRWHPLMMVLAHFFLLGFVGSVMIGSLFQMLPVVAGVPVANPVIHSRFLLGLFLVGMVGLVAGFQGADWSGWRGVVVALLAALTYFLLLLFGSLLKVKSTTPSVLGMHLAGVSLLCVLALGAVFILAYSGLPLVKVLRPFLTDAHASWAVAGWMGFLIQGVLTQVIPMFFVTPAFSKTLMRAQMAVLFSALLAKTLLVLFVHIDPVVFAILDMAVYGSVFFGAAYSLWLSFQRKRKVHDFSLLLIRFGLGSVIIAIPMILWPPTPAMSLLAFQVIALFGITSIVLGMLLKIVPFLVWFHLQAQAMEALASGRNVAVPTMKEIVSDKMIQAQTALHFVALGSYLWGFWSGATELLAVAIVLSFSFLLWVVAGSWWRYLSLSRAARAAVAAAPTP